MKSRIGNLHRKLTLATNTIQEVSASLDLSLKPYSFGAFREKMAFTMRTHTFHFNLD